MSPYDIVVMGAGHNGLVAAAYMAKAGKKVLVLERKPHYGGGVSTRELLHPGFWHDEHSNVHIMIQGNPMLREDELGLLSRFGLEYIYPDLIHVSIWDDGTVIRSYKDLDKTCEELARICGPKDAEAYRRFVQMSQTALPMLVSGLYSPPFPMGAFVAMMDQSDEGRFLLDLMQRTALDIVDAYFDSELLKLHIVRMVTENLQMPDELGTGMGAFVMPGIVHSYGCSMPKGGSGQLSHALVRAIEHFGGEVRCNAEVRRVIVSGGKAVGLELVDGETFMARDGVIGAIHPHVLRKFVGETPEPVLQRAERVTQSTFSINLTHMTLKERLRLKVGNDCNAMMTELMDFYTVRDMSLEYDKLRRGRSARVSSRVATTRSSILPAPLKEPACSTASTSPPIISGRAAPPRGTNARRRSPTRLSPSIASSTSTSPTRTSPAASSARRSTTSATARPASCAATSTAARRSSTSPPATARLPTSEACACPGSRVSILSAPSCTQGAACSARAAPRPSR